MAKGRGRQRASSSSSRGVRESEVSDDEIDAFHDQRDTILLDGRAPKMPRSRDDDHYDALAGSRSVLDVDEADISDGEDDVSDDEGEDDNQDAVDLILSKARKGKGGSMKAPMKGTNISDDDDDSVSNRSGVEEEELVGGWGSNKRAYYNTNNLDALESDSEMDEEEKRAMELREVKKLQQRSRQGMVDDDFGLGTGGADAESEEAARTQRRKDLDLSAHITTSTSSAGLSMPAIVPLNPAELIAQVQRDTPETLALVGEFADVVDDLDVITNRMAELQKINPDHPSLGLLHVHHQTLLTYVTTLIFYFYVRANSNSASSSNGKGVALRAPRNAIIERLAKLKAGLAALEGFGIGADEESDEEGEDLEGEGDSSDDEEMNDNVSFLFKPRSLFEDESSGEDGSQSLGSLEDDELAQLDAEEKENYTSPAPIPASKKSMGDGDRTKAAKKRKTKEAKGKTSESVPLAPLASIIDSAEADIADEMAPLSKRRKHTPNGSSDGKVSSDVYSEPTRMETVDQADKEAIRRSLKFHTGQADVRDGRGSARKLDGDVDIPYRDKDRSRQSVAATNANRAAKLSGPSAAQRQLDEDDFGEDDAQDWRDVMDVEGDMGIARKGSGSAPGSDEDYYDLITSSRKSEKEAKKAQYDAERMAQRIAPDAADLEDGEHRAINRQIEKNRGLTPRRAKAARNPRVKKRLRYEKAQKKLSSRGPVYKGGQAALQGGYGGESSGISSHVVKSRHFA